MSGEPVAEVDWSPVGVVGSSDDTFVSVYPTATQTLQPSVSAQLTFGVEEYDTLNEFSNNAFVPLSSGVYDICLGVAINNADASTFLLGEIKVNGVSIASGRAHASQSTILSYNISKSVYLNAGDAVTFYIYTSSSLVKTTVNSKDYTFVTIHRKA